ncbi:MAG: CcmD family protein [Bacteroidota bacterium]
MRLAPATTTPYDVPMQEVAVQSVAQDSGVAQADSTSPVATLEGIPEQQPEGLDRMMLAEDRLPVVLAVVLVVWIGVLLMLVRTDRRLSRLERDLDASA